MTHRLALLLSCAFLAAAHASPTGVAKSPDGSRIFVAIEDPPSIAVVDPAAAMVAATWKLPSPPHALALSPDGTRLYAPAGTAPGSLLAIDPSNGNIAATIPAGHSPRAAAVSPDGTTVFVCNQFENRVEITSVRDGKSAGSFPVTREPAAAALRPDGKALYVANLLPAGAANSGDIAAELGVIDTATGQAMAIRLPNGSTDARALALSPDGRHVYLVHTLARYGLPTTQLDRGWMNTSALSIIDAEKHQLAATILLDDIDLGAANPAGVACSPDGRLLAVTHAGTHELSLIDRAALHGRIDRAGRGEPVTQVSRSLKDLPNDLSFLHGIRNRVKLNGNGPRAIIATPEGFAIACYFSRTLHLVKTGTGLSAEVRDVPLAPDWRESTAQRGERMFYDATRCFQQWQSCTSCHPGVRADALNWDLLNDGAGNPKQTKSLLHSLQTPPAMISGIRPDGETAIRTGMRYILFVSHPEEDALAIEEFLRNLKPVPSPALIDGALSPAALRGKEVFDLASCSDCHHGPYLTNGKPHDVGTGIDREKGKAWDTPSLREIWRTAPYLHDGRAATLEDVIHAANPGDRHGETSTLTAEQKRDLVEYLRSL